MMNKLSERTCSLLKVDEMIGIVNSSPLIYLGKLGLLHLLDELFDKVLTVQSVKEEVLDVTAPEYPALDEAFSTWLDVKDALETPLSKKLNEMGLHRGEVDVISLAYEIKEEKKNSVAIIDDLAARDVARALGLRLTGTVGIILRAKKGENLSKRESILAIDFLVHETSFRMSASLYSKIIDELNE